MRIMRLELRIDWDLDWNETDSANLAYEHNRKTQGAAQCLPLAHAAGIRADISARAKHRTNLPR
jgi:hypothetical protein